MLRGANAGEAHKAWGRTIRNMHNKADPTGCAARTWKIIGAKGRAMGVSERVALFKMAASRPPRASTLPAGTA